jgi:dienelactone hydrolase
VAFLYLGCGGEIGDITGIASHASSVDSHATGSATSEIKVKPTSVVGHWYLTVDGARATLVVEQPTQDGPLHATVTTETAGAAAMPVDQLSYNPADGRLVFRVLGGGQAQRGWYLMEVKDGIATGRLAPVITDAPPSDLLAYNLQLIGWQEEAFAHDIVPRVFDLTIDGTTRAILRIDDDGLGGSRPLHDAISTGMRRQFMGQLKVYASSGIADEQLAENVSISHWDGRSLVFARMTSAPTNVFSGSVSGRLLGGTITADSRPSGSWTGERTEVLTHGLGQRSPAWMANWQVRTRARLARLAMDGNPQPLTTSVTTVRTIAPLPQVATIDGRDDNSGQWPQRYQLSELAFSFTLPDPAGGAAPISRQAHGYMAVPTTPPPAGGFPVAVALNGHWGSALQTFDPQNMYWYSDAFARRGYVVVAVDVGHRPLADRVWIYGDTQVGDDPANGNGTHPAIKAPGLASAWEEEGERVWDAMRALDHALARPDVNSRRVTVVGLSMGGAISDWFGAMDLRVQSVVVAGGPPDVASMPYKGNHSCWQWQRGNIREFFEPGDLLAMVSPRTLVLETGAQDGCYSTLNPPFASAKQVVQRARPAFDVLGGKLIHYLHYDAHTFHVGEARASGQALGLTTPMHEDATPRTYWSGAWQLNGETTRRANSLFDELP